MTVETAVRPAVAELHRQTDLLVERGCPALAGLSDEAFRALVSPLGVLAPDEPFVLVVTRAVVPAHVMVESAVLKGKSGFTTMDAEDVARFVPVVEVPSGSVYLVTDVDTGSETLNVRPDDALPLIVAAGRTPLTLEEGLAVAVQHPEWLRERNCFEMLGSRAGDKRVTGVWVSKGAPRLGWCWGGNPHTWLGMASAGRRIG